MHLKQRDVVILPYVVKGGGGGECNFLSRYMKGVKN